MNAVNHLLLAHQQAKSAATHHQNMATQCAAMAGLLDAMTNASNHQPHPIVELAQALLPVGLCILHKDAVKNALTVVESTTDTEGLARESLLELERSLNAALTGR